jgi:nitroreductase
MTAASAPSGANQQPWTFVVVRDQKLKHQIRTAAEKEEKSFYQQRAPNEWIAKLEPLGTDWRKPFLEDAPFLIIVFKQIYGIQKDLRVKHYYVDESVGIAVGFLLTAIHQTGLVALPHTPSPMGFLSQILKRPANERAYLIIPVGYPKESAKVPVITKKEFDEISDVF